MTETNPTVTIENFAETAVIYLRTTGGQEDTSQSFDNLSYQLYTWAAARNLVDEMSAHFFVIYHDDPEVTAVSHTRISICLPVPADTKVEGEIGKMTIPAGKLATLRLETEVSDLQSAWDWMFNEWLPNSGFTFDDRPYFERYPLDQSYANNKYSVDICVPVKPF